MGYTWTPGDALSAENLNKMNQATEDAISVNTHNIVELYLQQYFDGKNPDYNALFFDGFSDTTKTDQTINTTLVANASATDTTIDVEAFADSELNKDFRIEGTNTEVVKATAVTDTEMTQVLDSDDFNRADSTTVGNGWSDYEDDYFQDLEIEIKNNQVKTSYRHNSSRSNYYMKTSKSIPIKQGYILKGQMQMGTMGLDGYAGNSVDLYAGFVLSQDTLLRVSSTYDGIQAGVKVTADGSGNRTFYKFVKDTGATQTVALSAGDETKNWEVEIEVTQNTGTTFDYKVWIYEVGTTKPSTPTFTGQTEIYQTSQNYYGIRSEIVGTNDTTSTYVDETFWDNIEISEKSTVRRLTLASGLANAYSSGDAAKRTPITIDTTNKKLSLASGKVVQEYHSEKQSFQQSMSSARLWITRNWTARYNPSTAPSGTTVRITGDKTGQLATGDTVDIYTSDNITRERRTISAIDYNTTNSGETTITLNSALTGTYTTSDYIERVDAIPQLSLVASGASESFGNLTYVRSEVDFSNNEVEDEYTYTPASAGNDLTAKVTLTRNDTTLSPYAKRLGVSLNS